jgi:shikimate dehydrogenase
MTLAELRATDDFQLAVLGDPVDHSLSPIMQNAGIQYRLLPYRYGRLGVPEGELSAAFELLTAKQFLGWNITLPHKLKAFEIVDELDPMAGRLGAVNTVLNRSGKLVGFNTDGRGLVAAVENAFGKPITEYRIALLGAGGGAGQAVARYLAGLGISVLHLINRTVTKLEVLASELNAFSSVELTIGSWDALPRTCPEVDLIINASSSGLGNEGVPDGLDRIGPQHRVFDMVYGPSETGLVKFARAKGAESADGLSMLLYQGIFAFEIWFGKPVPEEAMRKALYSAVGRVGS